MRVKNLNGTTQKKCASGSWLAHWEKLSGQTAYGCFVVGCRNKRSVGGLVQREGSPDTSWYIVPLCEECGKKTGQNLDIWDLAMLVPADAREPEGKTRDKHVSPSRAASMEST